MFYLLASETLALGFLAVNEPHHCFNVELSMKDESSLQTSAVDQMNGTFLFTVSKSNFFLYRYCT